MTDSYWTVYDEAALNAPENASLFAEGFRIDHIVIG
jgi:hypothetical protein